MLLLQEASYGESELMTSRGPHSPQAPHVQKSAGQYTSSVVEQKLI